MNTDLPLPRRLSRILDDYRPRLAELRTPETYFRVLDALAPVSKARAQEWIFAGAALNESAPFIREDGIYDLTPNLQQIEAEEVAAQGAVSPGTRWYLINREIGWAHAAFEREGRNIYEVSNGLAEKLVHTELHGLKVADLRLPFRAIYVMAPPGSGLALSDGRSVTGAYLVECLPNVRGSPWSRFLVAHLHGPAEASDTLERAFASSLPLRVTLKAEDSIEETLSYRWIPSTPFGEVDARFNAFVKTGAPAVWRWLMNVILYLTMPGARLEHRECNRDRAALAGRIAKLPPGAKRDHLKLRLKGEPGDHRIYLGAGIKYEGRDPRIPGGRVQPDYVVRVPGHWKMQPHGPQGSLRKRIHIEPYWRNLDATVAPESVTRVTARSAGSASRVSLAQPMDLVTPS